MQQSLSRDANSRSTGQEILHLLGKPKVCYSVHKAPRCSISSARWIQSTSSHLISLRSTIILSAHLLYI